jgi:Raf kinase inhibitor-like YbhB/YbcL family protein
MKVTSTGIINGIIQDKYGKRGTQFNEVDIPTYSLPIKIENPPKGTVSYALVLEDKDAAPVCGFSWIHWLAANITKTELKENESIQKKGFVQGVNSWCGAVCKVKKELASLYGGMTPPDAPHIYELHIFALDDKLNLEDGFYLNELYKAMDGHVLEETTLKGCYIN